MKTLPIILAVVLVALTRAEAQVDVELTLNQAQFLPGEPMPIAAKITNRSGRQLHLGAEPNWLTFSVESLDGRVVIKTAEVPVTGEFDLESSQAGIKRVDIAPYFTLTQPGRYKVSATLQIKDWSQQITSPPQIFDTITGAKLWEQQFGLPASSGAPEMRKFALVQASYLNAQMRLYVQLSDPAEAIIYKTSPLGQTVSFSRPEAQIDRNSVLHVLWQSSAQGFSYCEVNPAGVVVSREIYDDLNSRPRLAVNENGVLLVAGGVRRPKPGEIPAIQAPVETPAPVTVPAPAGK